MANKREILDEMLGGVSDKYDKSDGSFIYNSLMPVAEQLVKVDESIQTTVDKMNIGNLSGDELSKRVKERTGIERKQATRAIGKVRLTGTGTINIGDLFETRDGLQFKSVEKKNIVNSGTVNVKCLVEGSVGNVPSNTITLFPITLNGFTEVTNEQPTFDGFDAESDSDLLNRYYDRIRTPSTSGNKNQFRNWAKNVTGVGDAKVIPLWNGDNTVKVIIINSSRQPSSPELVAEVQRYIDPNSGGTGEGVAPIGAFVTVESASGINVDISANIILSTGFTLQQAINNFKDNMVEHLASIAFVESIVSYAKIGAILLSTNGIEDYTDLTVNGGTSNLTVQSDEVAVTGVINLNE